MPRYPKSPCPRILAETRSLKLSLKPVCSVEPFRVKILSERFFLGNHKKKRRGVYFQCVAPIAFFVPHARFFICQLKTNWHNERTAHTTRIQEEQARTETVLSCCNLSRLVQHSLHLIVLVTMKGDCVKLLRTLFCTFVAS